jgi:ribose/xylose/arabinose/galactoside ABC-type transport system permease subunit
MSRFLITLGILLVIIGLAWPWLGKLGLGRLPGDIVIERENFRFYFPVTTMILVSLVVTVVLWLLRK